MIKVENITNPTGVLLDIVVKGMRNPMNSWDKSDSEINFMNGEYMVGDNDKKLMKQLIKAGTDHRKFLRQLPIVMEINAAPLYWWKEFETYKIGTVSNSCSTMHKIHAKEFTLDDFSCEHLNIRSVEYLLDMIALLNRNRDMFLKTKNKEYWWQMIQLLPSSYNQKRTITMNFENALNIINARKLHKLDEWRDFVYELEDKLYIGDCRFVELLEEN